VQLGSGIVLHYRIRGSEQVITVEIGRAYRDGGHGLLIFDEHGAPVSVNGILNWSIVDPTGAVLDSDVVI
jgi:hypothetical protein